MMQIALQEIEENELDDLLTPPDHLATAVYNLYCCPNSDSAARPRAVILTDERLQLETDPQAEPLTTDDACELLWQALYVDGRRIGDVVYNRTPEPGDHVFCPDGTGYRVSLPLPQPAALAVGAA